MIKITNIKVVRVGRQKEVGRLLTKKEQVFLITQIRKCLQDVNVLAEYEVK